LIHITGKPCSIRLGEASSQRRLTKSALKGLSHDLHVFADEATGHLKGAARKNGSEATEAVARSTRAITRAAERLREGAEMSAADTREHLSATVRDHPAAAGVVTSLVTSALVALVATFALVRLSQS